MPKPMMPGQFQSAKKLQSLLKTKPEKYWLERGQKMALKLFKDMAERVPAYQDFLKQHDITAKSIRTIKDFAHLPTLDKDNYVRKYPREALCWDGKLASERWVFSTTSGSTGAPFYFPRTDLQDAYYALTAELYLRENFHIQDKTTLYIDAFAMGAWIGGLFTYEAVKQVAEKGYSLSIITPGVNKSEVINSVKNLGAHFDQVIIGCYPPIMKDIIDLGIAEGLDWSDYNLGIVFSAEGFGEEFRDYIIEQGALANTYTSTLNHYGTVDMGTMSHETPLSIMIRRQAVEDKSIFQALFGAITKQPTLTQYTPELFYFEEANGALLCSAYCGLPLVRYDLKDQGGVLSLEGVAKTYSDLGRNITDDTKAVGIEKTVWNLPFVYLYERSDFSVSLVGGNIYPEEIRRALLAKQLRLHVSGKFTMEVVTDKQMNSVLLIHVELKSKALPSKELPEQISQSVVNVLLRDNSEYVSNYAVYGQKLWPQIKIWPHEDPLHFSGKGKQKWVKK